MDYINKLIRKTTAKQVWITLIAAAIPAAALYSMGFGLIKLNGDAVMDPLFFYNQKIFFTNLEIQGESGRISYLLLHLIDYAFISQFYKLLFYFLYLPQKSRNYVCKGFFLIPFLSALMDALENILIDFSILIFPAKIPVLGNISGYCTMLKFSGIYITFLLLMYILIRRCISFWNKTRS